MARSLKPPEVPDITQTTKALHNSHSVGLPLAGLFLTIYASAGNPNLVRKLVRNNLMQICGVSKDHFDAYMKQNKHTPITEDEE